MPHDVAPSLMPPHAVYIASAPSAAATTAPDDSVMSSLKALLPQTVAPAPSFRSPAEMLSPTNSRRRSTAGAGAVPKVPSVAKEAIESPAAGAQPLMRDSVSRVSVTSVVPAKEQPGSQPPPGLLISRYVETRGPVHSRLMR